MPVKVRKVNRATKMENEAKYKKIKASRAESGKSTRKQDQTSLTQMCVSFHSTKSSENNKTTLTPLKVSRLY